MNTRKWKPKLEIDLIPIKTLGKNRISKNSLEIINKITYKLRYYFKEPVSDVCMIMVYHPIMVKGGIK